MTHCSLTHCTRLHHLTASDLIVTTRPFTFSRHHTSASAVSPDGLCPQIRWGAGFYDMVCTSRGIETRDFNVEPRSHPMLCPTRLTPCHLYYWPAPVSRTPIRITARPTLRRCPRCCSRSDVRCGSTGRVWKEDCSVTALPHTHMHFTFCSPQQRVRTTLQIGRT